MLDRRPSLPQNSIGMPRRIPSCFKREEELNARGVHRADSAEIDAQRRAGLERLHKHPVVGIDISDLERGAGLERRACELPALIRPCLRS